MKRPSRFTVVMRANTDAHEPVASMRYPEKYTIRTPAHKHKVTAVSPRQKQHTNYISCEVSDAKSCKENVTFLHVPHRITNCHPLFPVLFIQTSSGSLDEICMQQT